MNKLNPHILLVMRWLQNNDLVSQRELGANDVAANAAYATALTAYNDAKATYASTRAADVAYDVAYAAYDAAIAIASKASAAVATASAAYDAAEAAAYDADVVYYSKHAKHCLTETNKRLNRYFKTTKEDREAYEQRAKYLNILGVSNE